MPALAVVFQPNEEKQFAMLQLSTAMPSVFCSVDVTAHTNVAHILTGELWTVIDGIEIFRGGFSRRGEIVERQGIPVTSAGITTTIRDGNNVIVLFPVGTGVFFKLRSTEVFTTTVSYGGQ